MVFTPHLESEPHQRSRARHRAYLLRPAIPTPQRSSLELNQRSIVEDCGSYVKVLRATRVGDIPFPSRAGRFRKIVSIEIEIMAF
jgi:hypothetical protein